MKVTRMCDMFPVVSLSPMRRNDLDGNKRIKRKIKSKAHIKI